MLTELISAANIAGFPHEYFTPSVYYYLKSVIPGGAGDYIDFIEKQFQTNNGVFGVEIDYDRYVNYWYWYFGPNIEKYKIILVDRKDFLSQIVSQYYVDVTKKGFDKQGDFYIDECVSLNTTKLRQTVSFLVRHKVGIRKINPSYRNLVYFEDIISGDFSKKIADTLELSKAEFECLKDIDISSMEFYFRPSDSQGKKLLKNEILNYVQSSKTEFVTYKHGNFVIKSIISVDGLEDALIDIDQVEPGLFYPFIKIEYTSPLFTRTLKNIDVPN
jgi:hypothetical protein